jgi:hypothetical protein
VDFSTSVVSRKFWSRRLYDYIADRAGYRIEKESLYRVGSPSPAGTILTRGGEINLGFQVYPLDGSPVDRQVGNIYFVQVKNSFFLIKPRDKFRRWRVQIHLDYYWVIVHTLLIDQPKQRKVFIAQLHNLKSEI